MALKRLKTGEMVSLSASWTEAGNDDRQLFLSIPVTAALLPQMDDAHLGLLRVQPRTELTDRAAAIAEEERILDVRHDNIIRGATSVLAGLLFLATDAQRARELTHLQTVLTPEGLMATQKTYRDESGQAALLASRLTPADIALLKTITTDGGTLLDVVNEWIAIGVKLGKLEDERTGLLEIPGPTPAEVVAARNAWIRTVNVVRSVLSLVQASEPGVQALLNRIAEAERRADKRSAPAEVAIANPVAAHATEADGLAEATGGDSSGG